MIAAPFAVQIVWVLVILCAAYACDRLLGRVLGQTKQWSEQHLQPSERLWVYLLGILLRAGLWLVAIAGVVTQLSSLKLFSGVLGTGVASVPGLIGQWINMPIADLGRTKLSLNTLVTACIAAIAIFIGARLLSQSIKRWFLGQSRMERGMQEAISTLITYAIAILGIAIVLQTIGLDLSSLTVLAGVLGLGFGLGLQELASNFVSGLTLLFEQQLRVGDFVEIDGLFGTIEQISIRSTILRTTDQRYVIVPNHKVFQNNVTNWSYQTLDTRIHVPVHVAFGSDTVLVTETLLMAARMEPRVLRHPSPTVWFKAFGENALEFELLVWINEPHDFREITSTLNFLMEQELRREGIEIPFPQRELRLRDAPWLERSGLEAKQRSTTEVPEPERTVKDRARTQPMRSLRFLLRQVSFFAHCSDPQLRVLIEQGYRRFFRPGQVIFQEGEMGDTFHIILKGHVEVVSEKLKQEIAVLNPGDFFGEISLFTGLPRSATIRAVEDTTLFVVDHRALKTLLQNYQELAEQIAESLAQRQQVLKELGILTPEMSQNEIDAPLWWIRQRIQTLFGL
jgi:potassium-dependent mechanosensitive channel